MTGSAHSTLPALIGALALHGGLINACLHRPIEPPPVRQETVLTASLIQIAPPKPESEPPKPLPVAPPKLKPAPQPVKKPEAKPKPKPKELTTSAAEPAAEPAPSAPVVEPPAPPAPSRAELAAEAPAPPVRTAPRFDAAYLNNPAPEYPALSRRLGEEGKVLLRVHVSPEGRATDVHIHQSSGYERLDETARKAVERWRFVPAKLADETVAAWVIVPIHFTLRN